MRQIGTEGAVGLGESRYAAQPGLSVLSLNQRETRDIILDGTYTAKWVLSIIPVGGNFTVAHQHLEGYKLIKVEEV